MATKSKVDQSEDPSTDVCALTDFVTTRTNSVTDQPSHPHGFSQHCLDFQSRSSNDHNKIILNLKYTKKCLLF